MQAIDVPLWEMAEMQALVSGFFEYYCTSRHLGHPGVGRTGWETVLYTFWFVNSTWDGEKTLFSSCTTVSPDLSAENVGTQSESRHY